MIKFNEENQVVEQETYKAILVGLQLKEDIEYSMKELKGLAKADNIEVLGMVIQNLEKPNSATFIGKGKVEEIKEMVLNMEADMVIFNDELTGMQMRNLEDAIGVRIIDRTILILDIFASRATSREGKLQVELAQLKYRMPRLLGFGKALSRQGAGIGTRGPGEKKLETDRRHIERRILDINKELKQIESNRSTQRNKREKKEIPVVALVGYTNSGKSALMNRILSNIEAEGDTVFEENMLFATLDTYQRKIKLEDNTEFILIDTVGFVSKLPHALIEAFKSTLEEVNYADLLIQVIDASYDNHDFHIEVTNNVLDEIGAGAKPKIMAYNKMDLVEGAPMDTESDKTVYISAKLDKNIDKLTKMIKDRLYGGMIETILVIPYDRGDVYSYLCDKANIIKTEYVDEGTKVELRMKIADYERLKEMELK